MHPLRHFLRQYVAVVIAALVPVAFTAFVAMPLSLGGHPGEPRSAQAAAASDGHMT